MSSSSLHHDSATAGPMLETIPDRRRQRTPRLTEELPRAHSYAGRGAESAIVERGWHSFRGQRRDTSFSAVGTDDSPNTCVIDFLQTFQVRQSPNANDESITSISSLVQNPRPELKCLDSESQLLRLQEDSLPSLSMSSIGDERRSRHTNSTHAAEPVASTSDNQKQKDGSVTHVGPTPLYDAVSSGAPIGVIKSLIQVDPSSTTCQNGAGFTPLHCALERYDTTDNILLLLLRANPQAASIRCKKGYNSVDLLWKRYIDPDPYRSSDTKERAAALREEMQSLVGSVEDHALDSKPSAMERGSQLQSHRALEDSLPLRHFWDLIVTFIHSACHAGSPEVPTNGLNMPGLIHDAAKLACDPLLIRFAASLQPELLFQRDHEGFNRLPIHIAAMGGSRSENALRILIKLAPDGVSERDADGRLPLHLAIVSRLSWQGGLEALVKESPESLTTLDPKTHLLPFLLAAASNEEDINSTYNLLRSSPTENLLATKRSASQ